MKLFKKNHSRFWAIVLAVIMIFTVMPVNAFAAVDTADTTVTEDSSGSELETTEVTVLTEGSCGAEGSTITYKLTSDGTFTISGNGIMSNYRSTSKAKAPWLGQGGTTDYTAEIKKVVIEEGITHLGNYAFNKCSAITEVKLPESLTSIGNYAFSNCTGITGVTLPSSLKSIGKFAFQKTALTEIIFPEGLETISMSAFANCTGLTSVHIPASLTTLSATAFDKSSVSSVTFAEGMKLTELGLSGTALTSFVIPEGITTLMDNAFSATDIVDTVVFPSTLTTLGQSTFYNCGSLKRMTIPETVTSIGVSTFMSCKNAERLEILAPITKLPSTTFTGCTKLREIVLPATLTEVSDMMLNVKNLRTVYFMGTEEQWNAITYTGAADYAGTTGMDILNAANVIFNYDPDKVVEPAVITKQPVGAEYAWADTPVPLSIEADVPEDAIVSYSWYVSDDATSTGSIAASKETENGSEIYFSCGTPGTKYYYCVITTIKDGGVATVTSDVVAVTVTGEVKIELEGEGTQEKPWMISSVDDLNKIYRYVAAGYSFENEYLLMTKDIELPADWKPIGVLKPGDTKPETYGGNVLSFNGNLDGGNHKLTIAKGGLPLFAYVHHSSVKNLNIYGEEINGAALINNYTVNYTSPQGYDGDIDTCDIENVTLLKGSSTKLSGLVQGNGSGKNNVNFTNCVIEKGVTIGYTKDQSNIGSLISNLNGTVRNCVSYAHVYGADSVGGLAAGKGQAMGNCRFIGSSFVGTITATGNYVGGIIGWGYDGTGSAPNTPCVTVKNCYVDATITGADYVGGILGAETGVKECWANGRGFIEDNHFYGTINSKGQYVGGIIGYMNSLNKNNFISNNYFVDSCGAEKGIAYVVPENLDLTSETFGRDDDPLGADADKLTKAMSKEAFADNTVLKLLNESETSLQNWEQEEKYPVLSDKPVVYELIATGEYKTTYITGEELDFTGMTLTATWTNGDVTNPSLSDVKMEGYNNTIRGKQVVTVIYGGGKAEIPVTVLLPDGKINVTVSILGDTAHGDNGEVHTLAGNNLTVWVEEKTYTVGTNATVLDVLEMIMKENNMGWLNEHGNYIQSVTKNGVSLEEFTNGSNSGWMFTVNGIHGLLGVSEQYMDDGDLIVFHYTDDYTLEEAADKLNKAKEEAKKQIAEYKNPADYREAEKTELEAIIAAAIKTIEAADTVEVAEKAVTDAKAKIDVLKTDFELSMEEATLEEAKEFAKKEVAEYKDADDYRAAQKEELKATIDKTKEAIEAATTVEEIAKVVADAKTAMDAIKTDEQLTKEESLADIDSIYKTTGDYIESKGIPNVGSVGGEWMVLGLTRSGREVSEDYYDNVVAHLKTKMNEKGQLDPNKSTDNSRVIIGLTAAGYDPVDVGGYNLLEALSSFSYITKQGLNGPVWALIALDTKDYEIPKNKDADDQTTREKLIDIILSEQLADGGWAISGPEADSDMTAMAVQALAPYYKTAADVKAAIDKAVKCLSEIQNTDGSYSTAGYVTSESISQVIVALATLGINPDTDERFVKNGNSVLDALRTFYVEGGGFKHVPEGKLNGMATEQGYYALVSYIRMLNGQTTLYDMSDVELKDAPVQNPDEKPSTPDYELSEATKAVISQIDALTGEDENEIIEAYKNYDALTIDEKLFVNNYNKLAAMTKALGEKYHYDEATGVDMTDNDETALPWYVKLVVKVANMTEAQLQKMKQTLGDDAAAFAAYDISLVDVLTGKEYTLQSSVNVKLPSVEKGSYKSLILVHFLADGTVEFLEADNSTGVIEVELKELGRVAVAGSMLDYDDIVGVEKEPAKTGDQSAIWLSVTTAAIAAFGVILILAKRREEEA